MVKRTGRRHRVVLLSPLAAHWRQFSGAPTQGTHETASKNRFGVKCLTKNIGLPKIMKKILRRETPPRGPPPLNKKMGGKKTERRTTRKVLRLINGKQICLKAISTFPDKGIKPGCPLLYKMPSGCYRPPEKTFTRYHPMHALKTPNREVYDKNKLLCNLITLLLPHRVCEEKPLLCANIGKCRQFSGQYGIP